MGKQSLALVAECWACCPTRQKLYLALSTSVLGEVWGLSDPSQSELTGEKALEEADLLPVPGPGCTSQRLGPGGQVWVGGQLDTVELSGVWAEYPLRSRPAFCN